jgi:polyisoprenoid-binding protein YceI
MKNPLALAPSCFAILVAASALTPALVPALAPAFANEVRVQVTLRPAGSFIARSSALAVKGTAAADGAAVSATDLVLDLDSLKTGIDLRDQHMRKKYFETDKYPQALLKSATGKDGQFTGELTLHGVTKPVRGTYTLQGEKLLAKFATKLTDFNIAQPKYLGVGVEDDVQVEVELPAKPQGKSIAQ